VVGDGYWSDWINDVTACDMFGKDSAKLVDDFAYDDSMTWIKSPNVCKLRSEIHNAAVNAECTMRSGESTTECITAIGSSWRSSELPSWWCICGSKVWVPAVKRGDEENAEVANDDSVGQRKVSNLKASWHKANACDLMEKNKLIVL
jgi:hypothetical protein